MADLPRTPEPESNDPDNEGDAVAENELPLPCEQQENHHGLSVWTHDGLYHDSVGSLAVEYGPGIGESWSNGKLQRIIADIDRGEEAESLQERSRALGLILKHHRRDMDDIINGVSDNLAEDPSFASCYRIHLQRELIAQLVNDGARELSYDPDSLDDQYAAAVIKSNRGKTHDVLTGDILDERERTREREDLYRRIRFVKPILTGLTVLAGVILLLFPQYTIWPLPNDPSWAFRIFMGLFLPTIGATLVWFIVKEIEDDIAGPFPLTKSEQWLRDNPPSRTRETSSGITSVVSHDESAQLSHSNHDTHHHGHPHGGSLNMETCTNCKGAGDYQPTWGSSYRSCPHCGGAGKTVGKIELQECPNCKGAGNYQPTWGSSYRACPPCGGSGKIAVRR